MDGSSERRVLGAIIAGGLSSRFGSPKALARVGGIRVVDRVANALRENIAADHIVAIINDAGLARQIGLPHRADIISGAGALGGVHAALVWARERGCTGILAAGCDMPFIAPALIAGLLSASDRHDAVLPASESRRGIEPLCAFYGTACIGAIEAATSRGDARMIGFHDDIRVHRMTLDVVRTLGDPARMFMNLNTASDHAAAERIAAGAS